ncbi:MAG: hypothetical protein DDG60_04450 [Anaerolineae bacterium]|nr:MAG: hypothetical protein DDG60_04450 [Anaerolineae bacterium]
MPYFSGGKSDSFGPLARYLPPTPEGIARAFLAEHIRAGAWVLDPFGACPRFSVEMARAGARVLVTASNPINRFLLDLAAHPPTLADLQAALAELSAARKEDDRLETHLQALYLTQCLQCKRELPAESFLWDSRSGRLTGKIYNCTCGAGGEQPATAEDEQLAAQWSRADALHRSRALGRIAPPEDPHRPIAQEALAFYPPRAVYALGTLINRLDAIQTSKERRRCILALLLWAFDAVNSLWPHPIERPRPRQLILPSVFRENNVWMALEAAVKALHTEHPPIAHTLWPEEPPESGGLCIYEGPLRNLAAELHEIPFRAVMGVLPRPNQAFWTLSALWAGWLWGYEAVGPFKRVLGRRRYDWNWHAEALQALFTHLTKHLPAGVPFFGLLTEPEPGFISAVLHAAGQAGLDLSGLALRGEQEPLQIHWKTAKNWRRARHPLHPHRTHNILRQILATRGTPLPYIHLHALALSAFAVQGVAPAPNETLAAYDTAIHTALQNPEFTDLENRSTPETGTWALSQWKNLGMFEPMPEP